MNLRSKCSLELKRENLFHDIGVSMLVRGHKEDHLYILLDDGSLMAFNLEKVKGERGACGLTDIIGFLSMHAFGSPELLATVAHVCGDYVAGGASTIGIGVLPKFKAMMPGAQEKAVMVGRSGNGK